VGDGTGDIVLLPGESLRDLKKKIKQKFGKVKYQKVGKLYKVDGGKQITSKDLVDGVTVKVTYSDASGNNVFGGMRRFGFW